MALYKNSTIDTYDATGLTDGYPCKVQIEDRHITVSYDDEKGKAVTYSGQEVSPGHFELSALSVKGHATLHQLCPDSLYLEGWWKQGSTGMWRIHLIE